MNKKDLESAIAQKMDIPQKEAHLFIQTMMEIIIEVLKDNGEVSLQILEGSNLNNGKYAWSVIRKTGIPANWNRSEPLNSIPVGS